MRRIGLASSEERSFENVDDGRTMDTSIYYKLTFELSGTVGNLMRGSLRGTKRIKKGEISMKSKEINEI